MATWSLVQGNVSTKNRFSNLDSDGVNIYFAKSTTVISRYNMDTDTLTDISNASSFTGGGTIDGPFLLNGNFICWFKDNLYTAIYNGTDTLEVWQYDGTGTSWTKRHNVSGPFPCHTFRNDNYMVVIGFGQSAQEANAIWYSSDGTSWSQGTIGINIGYDDWAAGANPLGAGRSGRDTSKDGMIVTLDEWTGGSPNISRITYKFNESTKAMDVEDDPANQGEPDGNYQVTDMTYNWGYFANKGRYGTGWSGFSQPATNVAQQPAFSINMDVPLGVVNDSGTAKLDYWTGTDWDGAQETLQAGHTVSYPIYIIRSDNSELFSFVFSSPNWDIVKRDTPYPIVSTTKARFYQGAGTLTERFTLPFTGVAPNAMTLNAPLGTVVLGSDAPTDVPMVSSVAPYVTGTASAAGLPTGSAFTAVDWI